ncbi:MAG: DNA recombination protein RmuC [Minisyncoccia bacterium]
MELTIILIVFGFAILLIAFFMFYKKNNNVNILLLQKEIQQMQQILSDTLKNNEFTLQSHFSESLKMFKEVNEKVNQLNETNKQVINFTEQLKNIEDILKNPKQRGVIGEYFLEHLLSNILPPDLYQMQYKFKNGDIVDAVIFIGKKPNMVILPIDSKFSLENYNRIVDVKNINEKEELEKLFINDLKQRIKETAKYVRPEEGTTDYAFMFIPHEAIYYDLLINKIGAITKDTESLIQQAANKYKVIIVSPTTLFAYLQTVLQLLHAITIQESAKELQQSVSNLQKHLLDYEAYFIKLGNNLKTTVNSYNDASNIFKKIPKDVFKITNESMDSEVMPIEHPEEN